MQKLLLLHGALGSKEQFKEPGKKLADFFEIFTLNFSGHGGTSIPEAPFSIEMFARDVLNFLDENKIANINIFGYSMGGYVGLYLAKHNPERINRLFTLASKLKWNDEIAARESKMLNPPKIKEKIPAFAEELRKRHYPNNWETVMTKTSEMMTNLGKKNEFNEEDYNDIEHNVLLTVGDRDKMVSIEETIEAYRKLKNGQLLILPGTPHPLENVNIKRLFFEIERFMNI